MHFPRRALILGAACAFLAHPGLSQSLPLAATADLQAIDAQIRRGDWSVARDATLALIETARTSLLASDLAGAVARLALAEAGVGQEEEAAWHWHVAQNLDRSVLSMEALASFGKPGETLARHALRQSGAAPAGLTVLDSEDPQVRPGRRTTGAIPKLSPAVANLPAPLTLRLQVVIGTDGRPREPVVLAGSVPGMIWEVLEGVRSWRYEPARRGEETVAVFRNVSINASAEQPFAEIAPLPVERGDVERMLRRGSWKAADRAARVLWAGALNVSGHGARDLAAILALRALAEAGLGHEPEAVCRWHAAQHLDPRLHEADLSAYGAAGALLEKNRWGDQAPGRSGLQVQFVKQGKLEAPQASRVLALKGTVVLAATVGPDGSVRQPLLLRTDSAGQTLQQGLHPAGPERDRIAASASALVALSALDSVCDWRFRADGPVPVQTVLHLPFEIKFDGRSYTPDARAVSIPSRSASPGGQPAPAPSASPLKPPA